MSVHYIQGVVYARSFRCLHGIQCTIAIGKHPNWDTRPHSARLGHLIIFGAGFLCGGFYYVLSVVLPGIILLTLSPIGLAVLRGTNTKGWTAWPSVRYVNLLSNSMKSEFRQCACSTWACWVPYTNWHVYYWIPWKNCLLLQKLLYDSGCSTSHFFTIGLQYPLQ